MENLKINPSSLLKVAPLAAAASAAINAVLFYIGEAIGTMDPTIGVPQADGSMQYITIGLILMSSSIPILIGAGILALLNRFTANPLRIYGIITIVMVVLTIANPFLVFPVGMGVWLNLMHFVVAGVAWYAYSRYTK